MTQLQQLEREAIQKRLEVDAALGDLCARLTMRNLADDAAALIMPRLPRVMPIHEAIKRHPVVAVAMLAIAGWLFAQRLVPRSAKKANHRNLRS